MEPRQIKFLAIVILAMLSVMLSWVVFWPTNFSPPQKLIIPFNAPPKLFMFFSCLIIILALISVPHLGFFTNSNGVIADDSFYDEFGEIAYCQQHIASCAETAEQETPGSEDGLTAEKMKFICSADHAGDNTEYTSRKSEKVGCRDIIMYQENYEVENCFESVLPELMQLVEVPAVIDIKKYNELASMIDEDFNRTVEEFIAKFKRQLSLQRQQPISLRG